MPKLRYRFSFVSRPFWCPITITLIPSSLAQPLLERGELLGDVHRRLARDPLQLLDLALQLEQGTLELQRMGRHVLTPRSPSPPCGEGESRDGGRPAPAARGRVRAAPAAPRRGRRPRPREACGYGGERRCRRSRPHRLAPRLRPAERGMGGEVPTRPAPVRDRGAPRTGPRRRGPRRPAAAPRATSAARCRSRRSPSARRAPAPSPR